MKRAAAIALAGVAALASLVACRPGGVAEGGTVPTAGAAATPPADPGVERLTLRVVARHPHDSGAWTQGLLWHDGALWESTGLHGRSSLRRVDLTSGRVLEQAPLPREVFGEGLALAGGRLVQLTWQDGRAFFWDPAGLALLEERRYEGEGWGLAFDGTRLVQSDGTAWLTFRDPATFAVTGRQQVTRAGRRQPMLNELEAVGGEIWANVWTTAELVRVDAATGRVTGQVDAAALWAEATATAAGAQIDVLNGIAWRPETGTFLLTGKLWPVLFEVELVPARPAAP
jgi:glutamine cyclotransferase